MKSLLVKFGLWLARMGGWTPPVCWRSHPPETALVVTARRLVNWAEETFPGTSGEHKRHQVYARMLRLHQDVPRRQIALAIEWALQ